MSTSTSGPATYRQPSRKGKRAWRKNVDITEVQDGLSAAREEEIITGGKLFADVPSETLFHTDSTGDIEVRKQYQKSFPKLKSDEILAQRSAIPAVDSRKRKADSAKITDGVIPEKRRKGAGVSRKELERLRMVAFGGDSSHKNVVEGVETATYDPWEPKEATEDPSQSFIDQKQHIREPKTVKEAPVSLTVSGKSMPNVSTPHAGRSYNPTFTDWDVVVKREGAKEVEAEKKRLQKAEVEKIKQDRAEAAAAEAEKANDNMSLDAYESEWEGFQSDLDDAQMAKKRPQRKTPAERNKINRRKEAERQAKHEAKMKARDQQAKRIQELKQAVDEKEALSKQQVAKVPNAQETDSSEEEERGEKLRRRAFRKSAVPDAPLEVVLADELQDSLRRLKPEGNLLKDRFRNLMLQGKVEARRPVGQTRQAKTKATEKWSYKDWKLPVRAN